MKSWVEADSGRRLENGSYTEKRSSTYRKVSMDTASERPTYTATTAAEGVMEALQILEGRWKMTILFHLFDKGTLRFLELSRAIPGISEKMLIQQLKKLENDGIVARVVYPQVPPKVEYSLTPVGQALCPALDALLQWAEQRKQVSMELNS